MDLFNFYDAKILWYLISHNRTYGVFLCTMFMVCDWLHLT